VTQLDQLHREILGELQRYTAEIQKEINKSANETAKELVKDLKTTRGHKDKTGDYRKGWRIKKMGKKYIVHNATDYQLTHLLEHGHAKRGGGRVEARIHIAPAEDIAVSAFLQKVERAVRS
jgi:hypothetical protein